MNAREEKIGGLILPTIADVVAFQPIIDALTAHIALIDKAANIVGVNRAWIRFSEANNNQQRNHGIGYNYLDLLEKINKSDCCGVNQNGEQAIAAQISNGLRRVLSGQENQFQIEYPCDSPTEKRWFLLTITPLQNPGSIRAVVAHEDLTALKLAQEVTLNQAVELADSFSGTVDAIALFIEKRDAYTAGHQHQVSSLCNAIAGELGLNEQTKKGLVLGAKIHDIGKIAIPVDILGKPGRLSPPELEIIRSHPQVGYEILSGMKFPWPIADMVCQHHERLDGSGYPRGLSGNEICLEARIIAVADVFDAIMSHRPYRPAKGKNFGINELLAGRGSVYDPVVVDAFLACLNKSICD